MSLFLLPLRFVAEAVSEESSPRALALGFTLGVLIGLVPKGNLIAVALMIMLGASRVNLGMGMIAAFAFSWVGAWTDPVSHRAGLWLLEQESLTPYWAWFGDLPLAPWTSFNNTVVMGSFALGLAMCLPVYLVSAALARRYAPSIQQRLQRIRFVRLVQGASLADRFGSV